MTPTTAAEWVRTVPLDCPHPEAREVYVCYDCAAANLDAYARQQAEAALERAATIQRKCEQYWNESIIEEAEMHAVLEFIHREAAALRGGTG